MKLDGLSLSAVKEFKKGYIWRYIEGEIKRMKKELQDDMTVAPKDNMVMTKEDGTVNIVDGIDRLQGANKMLDYLIGMLDEIIEDLTDLEEAKENAETGREEGTD